MQTMPILWKRTKLNTYEMEPAIKRRKLKEGRSDEEIVIRSPTVIGYLARHQSWITKLQYHW